MAATGRAQGPDAELSWSRPRTSPWFSRALRGPCRARVFAFPHSGGSGPSSFGSWLAVWPDSVELCAARLPGRPGRLGEQPLRDYDGFTSALLPVIEPLCDAPFALFGASLGAVMAFHLVRRLAERGLVPRHLFLAACPVPSYGVPHRAHLHRLDDADFVREVERAYGAGLSRLLPDALAQVVPGLRADFEMIETGRPPARIAPLGCPVSAYAGIDDPLLPVAAVEEWAAWTDRFSFRAFPRGHFFLAEERDALVGDIAAALLVPGELDGDRVDAGTLGP